MFANNQYDFDLDFADAYSTNVTFGSSYSLATVTSSSLYFGNCIFANVTNTPSTSYLSGNFNGFYDTIPFGANQKTNNSGYPFQAVNGGDYYLTTNCAFHAVGTTNIDSALLAELAQKTTWPPLLYNSTSFSVPTNFGPYASRDTNTQIDLGYHYDPLDYIFINSCQAYTNITFTKGTAAAWSTSEGIQMRDPLTVTLSGTATSPDYWVRCHTVQEEDSNGSYGAGGLVSESSTAPIVQATFTRMSMLAGYGCPFRDDSGPLIQNLNDCEFSTTGEGGYGNEMNATNCLFDETYIGIQATCNNCADLSLQNCTLRGSSLLTSHWSGAFWPVYIKNSAFDGMDLSQMDAPSGASNNYIFCNFNSFLSSTNQLAFEGTNTVIVTNGYNWQTSWFGNFYLPTNSPVIEMGSTNANYLGLYHFTTQTNQTPEGTNIVDIGYHYVATDTNGNPKSTPGDGIPDYIADANGNGIDDPGETPWDIAILSQPQSTNVAQGQNANFSVTVGGNGPFTYQWLLNGTNISTPNSPNYTALVVQQPQDGSLYSVIATNNDGSVTSSVAVLGVEIPFSITNYPPSQTNIQGANVSFYIGVSGNYLDYQWSTNNTPIGNGPKFSGVTNNTLTISNIVVSDTKVYSVSVTNLFGSQGATPSLTVVTNPVISPISLSGVIQSDDATFSVTPTDEPYYQWSYSNSVYGQTNIPNANNYSYTQLVVQPTNDGLYSVVVTNLAGSTNATTSLTVLVPPWITQQPATIVTNQGDTVTFSISAFGTTNLYYQWFENGTNSISGATTNSYTLTSIQLTNAGGYSCLVSNSIGTNMSAWAWLSVIATGGGSTNSGPGGGNPFTNLPSVAMFSPTNTSPTNPAVFPYGNPISIRADAFSKYGYITNVAFYFTGTNSGPGTNFTFAGNAVSGPNGIFALAWTNALPGTNILKARAWDYNDTTNDSTNLTYVIMTLPPSFARAPDTNIVWTEGIGSTNVFLSTTWTNDGQPYSYVTNINWTVSSGNGQYVTISASNSLSTQVTFSTNDTFYLQLEVDNGYATNIQPTKVTIERHPQLSFNSPTQNDAFLTNTPIVLSATAIPYDGNITGVAFYTNTAFFANGIQSVNNTWTYLWSGAPLGTNNISAVAYCSDGLTTTQTVNAIVIPPLAVWFLAPTNNQLFILSPTNILLWAWPLSSVGSIVDSVEFTNQTQSLGLGAGVPQMDGTYQYLWEDVTNGTNIITVTAKDNFGNIATNEVSIVVNAMPIVSIVHPTNEQQFVEVTNVTLSATATDVDDTISQVQFYNFTNILGTATAIGTNGNFNITWTNRVAGNYPVVAVATDARGASAASEAVIFKVTPTNPPPTIVINYPANNEVFADGSDITIEAFATNYPASVTNVEFFINGESIGSMPNPPYAITECCWLPGTYQLTAVAEDSFGSSSSTNVQITILPATPTPQGFWDPAFALSSANTLFGGGADGGDGLELAYSCFSSDGTLYVPATIPSGPYVGYNGLASTSDGTNWSYGEPLPDYELDSFYTDLYLDTTNIYAGYFNYNGGPAWDFGIYRWDSSSNQWDGVGDGLNGNVYAICRVNGVLYVGGDFSSGGSDGNTNIQYIAKLDEANNRWLPVGNGLSEGNNGSDTNAFTYNGFGEALTSTDARGNTTFNSYDGSGELTNTVDALGDGTTNTYTDGLLISSIDPISTTTINSYDVSGNLTNSATLSASGAILSSNTYTYDANGNRVTSTVWRHVGVNWTNATTTYDYDAQNRVVQTVDPADGTNIVVYNLIGQQAETIDANGNMTTNVYDALGHLIETLYPDGTHTTSAYDAVGNRTNITDELNRPTTYVYDALNRVIETIYPDGATNATIYDDVGRVSQTIDARGIVTANAYDAAGRRIAVTNAFTASGGMSTNSYSYDPNGNQITSTDANGHKTTNVYDPLNRQVQVQYPDGTTTETVYDSDGRSVSQTNQDDVATWFAYDGAGRLVAVTNALQQVTHYQYDEAGNEIAQIDALGRTNTFAYDGQGRRISHTMPGGQSEEFAYDPDGNQIYATNFNGAVITNTYDAMNRLTQVSSLYGYNVNFTYSATGQRTNMVDPSGAYAYAYDARDRLLQKAVNWNKGPTNLLSYAYDSDGNVTNIFSSSPNGVNLIYAYDPLNRLTNVLANGNATAAYAYDLAGNLQTMRYGNGVTNLYQYDSLNRLTNAVWKLNVNNLANFSYQLGPTGNRTNLSESVGGTNILYSWQYDNLYRLTNELFNASSNIVNGYDVVGNRTSRTSHIGALTNQVFSFNTNDWLSTDKYDNNGNTTNSGIVLYQYDVMNHLTNAGGIVMTYDGDGNRISKKSGSTTTYYLADDQNPSGYAQVLEEWTVASSTNLSKVYNYGLGLISQRQPGISTNYFIYDGHGSTRMLMDIGGNMVNVMAYDAFGNLIATNGILQTSYLYSGQQYDPDLGLYYNRARYVNTGTGRFWTMDTDEGDQEDPLSLHKYLYGADDPVNLDDPSGNDYGDFNISLASIFGFISLIGSPVTSESGFTSLEFAPAIIVYISVDPQDAPSSFHPTAVQSGLQSQLSAKVFDNPPVGRSVTIKVHTENSPPGTTDWHGSPKNIYIDRVSWDLSYGIASSGHSTKEDFGPGGYTSINAKGVIDYCKKHGGGPPTDQTYINIFAHEVIWLNAGGNWDHDVDGSTDISNGKGYPAFDPFTVSEKNRLKLRNEFGF